MNNIIKTVSAALLITAASCSDWTDMKRTVVDAPEQLSTKDESYYENLRAYKRSNHELYFGWFGGWNPASPSKRGSLASIPDSVDIISIWGMVNTATITPEQREELALVQNKYGSKVTVTILLGWVGKGLPERTWPENREEALREYARALAEDLISCGFNGLDIDFEPTIGGVDDVNSCPVGAEFTLFVEELGKYLGPLSGSGRLLIVDGQLDLVPAEAGKYFDYAVSQAYYETSPDAYQWRYDAVNRVFSPQQFIVTEDFERHWSTGGTTNFRHPLYGTIPSLLGMAYWEPRQGRKGGCGSYHMEYEYGHDPDYKYLRQAIQIMNPTVR
jgi:hypothetical protein